MPGDIIGWYSRAGEDELTWMLAIIYCATHMVPELRLQLPLIYQ